MITAYKNGFIQLLALVSLLDFHECIYDSVLKKAFCWPWSHLKVPWDSNWVNYNPHKCIFFPIKVILNLNLAILLGLLTLIKYKVICHIYIQNSNLQKYQLSLSDESQHKVKRKKAHVQAVDRGSEISENIWVIKINDFDFYKQNFCQMSSFRSK